MKIRQKFFVLSGLVGVIIAVMSCVGYYTAYTNLERSVEGELSATVGAEAQGLDGWIHGKANYAVAAATIMPSVGNKGAVPQMQELLKMVASDKEVVGLVNATETGTFVSAKKDNTGKVNPQERGWYKQAKAANGKLSFTEVYKDSTNGKLVVTAAMPYDADGKFAGAICEDIELGTLETAVGNLKYHGEGKGLLISPKGNIIASTDENENMKPVSDNAALAAHFDEMVQKGEGYFSLDTPEGKKVLAYQTIPTTGWIMGISVPEDVVFASLTRLKITYAILTLLGILIAVAASLKFADSLSTRLERIREHANEFAQGNLAQEPIVIDTQDETGDLAAAFNTMGEKLRSLISDIAKTSEQVAAASEELTANAHQSAEASTHVAQTVSTVSDSMNEQTHNVEQTKDEVDGVYTNIATVTDKTKAIETTSEQTAAAAQEGSRLMENAIGRMEAIETSVKTFSDVVQKLGASSQEIGAIVETISAIAEQTNLLALNAAIEAARAGEHGRGFSVVADEVRKLAEESQNSAEEIRTRIAAIQNDTDSTVRAIEQGTQDVAEGTQAVRSVSTQFQSILDQVHAMSDEMQGIADSVRTLEAGADRIVTAVDGIQKISNTTEDSTRSISAATEEQSASTEEIAAASQTLAQMAEDLQKATNQFKL
ncbi:MAG: methyl-accepting chemotaxis protein [Selenomonas sp.]|uniref:methyl-accepting chemotaxis protein n=2 Tax=Selenomonas sp. TaxID=2053611 RepID=UPI0025EA499D|nr:methyl-accepting chemotaxis protein [Selenomonas sp.]MCI6086579.1 methyl-accepting chemotaxis protein [Selenomonas sp.]